MEGWPFFDPLFNIMHLFLRERSIRSSALSLERFLYRENCDRGAGPLKYIEALQKSYECSEGVVKGLTAWVVLIAVSRKYMLESPKTDWHSMSGDMRTHINLH